MRNRSAKAYVTYFKELSRIERQQLLIIDVLGIQPIDAYGRSALIEIVEDSYGKSSTILISLVLSSLWHEIIGEQTIEVAIPYRLVHNSFRTDMKG
jgi:DNA replication protein DnaC